MDKKSRKELAQEYQQRTLIGGVCAIVNTTNDKRLIISATEVDRLHNLFDFSISTGTFTYMELQKDAAAYGVEVFEFEVLELLEKKDLQSLVQFQEDISVLCDIWKEKYDPAQLY